MCRSMHKDMIGFVVLIKSVYTYSIANAPYHIPSCDLISYHDITLMILNEYKYISVGGGPIWRFPPWHALDVILWPQPPFLSKTDGFINPKLGKIMQIFICDVILWAEDAQWFMWVSGICWQPFFLATRRSVWTQLWPVLDAKGSTETFFLASRTRQQQFLR